MPSGSRAERLVVRDSAAWHGCAEGHGLEVLGRNFRKDKAGLSPKTEATVIAWFAENDATGGSAFAQRAQGFAHEA